MERAMKTLPQEEDILNRINRHLSYSKDTETVALIWSGYISALLEWGLISPDSYQSLSKKLPEIGNAELYELFMDEPFPTEKLKS